VDEEIAAKTCESQYDIVAAAAVDQELAGYLRNVDCGTDFVADEGNNHAVDETMLAASTHPSQLKTVLMTDVLSSQNVAWIKAHAASIHPFHLKTVLTTIDALTSPNVAWIQTHLLDE